jgi:hypothetical protein
MVERYRPQATVTISRVKRFTKGMARPANAGRKKGIPNHRTALIKDSALQAGAEVGLPEPIYRYVNEVHKVTVGKKTINKTVRVRTDEVIGWKRTGKYGLKGYMMWLALNHPASYTTLLNRILPMQLNVKADITETVVTKFANLDPSTMTLEQKLSAVSDMISLTQPRQLPSPQSRAAQLYKEAEDAEYEDVTGSFREAAE